ncbi:hypothetical protein X805_15010 [Sphaerotilus natans subsp. natans DSM 6575]|uniref:AAA+ ATPase domain-containing protein n=1 Tax=Sphaerotilus natans subsp. natans DSM 6575 TaxID=1286631 RepID=A0A059KN41_9BURK|nr:MoxR family ATPase [Sphaerotilus natans]KDB52897.1 hypothetical protein X805_15010 [Sphaerotilus natans subsp. natans DSM 6575]SIS05264.1 RNA helicase [Sphaerotilus natans]
MSLPRLMHDDESSSSRKEAALAPSATITQVRELLRHQLRQLEQPGGAACMAPLMIWGAPGVGKSTVIRELCAQEGIGFIDIRLSQREPVDLRGLPVPHGDQVRWLLSSEWPRDPNSRGILLFDELTSADRMLQVAAYEMILDRRLGDLYQVPPGWLICAAGNRREDRAVSQPLSSALANRFCHLELKVDLPGWIAWAQQRELHPMVIAFLKYRPHCFLDMSGSIERGWPSPRSWERVAHVLTRSDGLDAISLELLVHGLVGTAAATEFLAFMRLHQELPDLDAMLLGEIPFDLPERMDLRHAVATGLAQHLWSGPVEQRELRLTHFLRAGLTFGSDFAVMSMVAALKHIEQEDPQGDKARALFSHPLYTHWTEHHGAALVTHDALPAASAAPHQRRRR